MMTSFLYVLLLTQGSVSLPEGYGLSSKYPGDVGMASDSAVLLFEDFENGTIEDLARKWDDVSNVNREVLEYVSDVPANSKGKRSLQMTSALTKNTGGHLYTRLSKQVDKVFARFYVKFAPDAGYTHHFVRVGGYNPPTRWPQGRAGTRPDGDDWFSVGIEPFGDGGKVPPPGRWGFYVYWQEMKQSADGKFWGNGFHPANPSQVPRNRWQCIEVMVKLNSTPNTPDGELALWVNGKLQAHFVRGVRGTNVPGIGFTVLEQGGEAFDGFKWRKSNDLKINYFCLLHYVTEGALRKNNVTNPNPINRVMFDHVVVATEYIGPIHPK